MLIQEWAGKHFLVVLDVQKIGGGSFGGGVMRSKLKNICRKSGIHLENDMSVPFEHTIARTVCLFEMVCAPNQLNVPFFKLYVPQIC